MSGFKLEQSNLSAIEPELELELEPELELELELDDLLSEFEDPLPLLHPKKSKHVENINNLDTKDSLDMLLFKMKDYGRVV